MYAPSTPQRALQIQRKDFVGIELVFEWCNFLLTPNRHLSCIALEAQEYSLSQAA